MGTKHIFIINPMAGKGKAVMGLSEALKQHREKYDIEIYPTASAGDATEFVCNTLTRGSEENTYRFYSCGGDGSLNEVANGAMRSGKDNYVICPYPCGSGNDFVKALGGKELYSDVEKLLDAEASKIDVIKVGDNYAVNAVHFGFDTKVARVMQAVKRKPLIGGKRAYTTGVAVAFLTAMKSKCKLVADGETVHDGEFLLCTLANGQYVGGKYRCAPLSQFDDGLIEVCMVKPISRPVFLKLVKLYERGEHISDERFKDIVSYRRAKKLTLSSETKDFAFSVDGEVVYGNDMEIEIMHKALNIVVLGEPSAQ